MSDLIISVSSAEELKDVYCDSGTEKGKQYSYVVYEGKWTITWLIENFSEYSSAQVINSKKFNAGFDQTMNWTLQVRPKGDPILPGYVAVYLNSHFDSSDIKTHIICNMSLLNISNENNFQYNFSKTFTKDTVFGCTEFIERSYLLDQKDSLLPNDTLKLCCEIQMHRTVDSVTYCSMGPKLAKLSNDFSELCFNSKLSDVDILVKEKKFSVHKVILEARCPVLLEMLEHSLKESKTNIVEINDIEPKVMEEIMHYIYSGHCPRIEDMACDILPVANKYCLTELKKMAEEILSTKITPGNAVEKLILAHTHSAPLLKANALNYISRCGMEVMNTSGWNYIKEYPDLLLDICSNTFIVIKHIGDFQDKYSVKNLRQVKSILDSDFLN